MCLVTAVSRWLRGFFPTCPSALKSLHVWTTGPHHRYEGIHAHIGPLLCAEPWLRRFPTLRLL